jgi:hypothetical protein
MHESTAKSSAYKQTAADKSLGTEGQEVHHKLRVQIANLRKNETHPEKPRLIRTEMPIG